MYGAAPRNVYRPICSPRSIDSSKNACDSFCAIAKNALTGVNRSALTDLTTGISVASRANWENSLKSGCSMMFVRGFHYRGETASSFGLRAFGLQAFRFRRQALGFYEHPIAMTRKYLTD